MVNVNAAARDHGGTCHICAADQAGNLVSMTFTHGQGFGALVTVDGLGLILGHGVSRFDADPKHPNAPGPGKRPLNNMCPTVVVRNGRPVLAIGGRGGRRIPNALAGVLRHYAGEGLGMPESVAAQRLHTEGDHVVIFQGERDDETVQYLKSLGYSVNSGKVARVDAAAFDPSSSAMATAFN
jgi:gamma-glutamyltranspeptidase/glutathione hydrolase